eukprot:1304168-Pleurochrysis_carterae.AAC.2
MEALWDCGGVSCEIVADGTVHTGDELRLLIGARGHAHDAMCTTHVAPCTMHDAPISPQRGVATCARTAV